MIAKSIKILKEKIIKNKKGDIIKFFSKKNKYFRGFGEVYFSEINKGSIKGWNSHKKNISYLCVPFGKVVFIILNKKKVFCKKIILEKKKHRIIIIPPGFWFSFKSLTKKSIVANLMNKPHSKSNSLKLEIINNTKIK